MIERYKIKVNQPNKTTIKKLMSAFDSTSILHLQIKNNLGFGYS